MTTYSQCSRAIAELAGGHAVFTELDVVNMAATDGWGKKQLTDARKYANQIVSARYREGKLARYGPVEVEINGSKQKDYARRASVIVYGGSDTGPDTWDTDNGSFPKLLAYADDIRTPGRRAGIDRADETLWAEQEGFEDASIKILKPRRRPVSINAESEAALKSQLIANEESLRAAHEEIERLKAMLTADPGEPMSRDQVDELVLSIASPLEERLIGLEERIDKLENPRHRRAAA